MTVSICSHCDRFVAVAQAGRLTAAPEREHLALGAVSKRVSDLEQAIDATLLYRRPRGVELTPAGDALLLHARSVLESFERLTADLSECSAGVCGPVRTPANTSVIIQLLTQGPVAVSSETAPTALGLQAEAP